MYKGDDGGTMFYPRSMSISEDKGTCLAPRRDIVSRKRSYDKGEEWIELNKPIVPYQM